MIPGLGRSPGEGKGNPLQYSGLENSMGCILHGVAYSMGLQSRKENTKYPQVLHFRGVVAPNGHKAQHFFLPCSAYWGNLSLPKGFPDSSAGKESTRNAGDPASIPSQILCSSDWKVWWKVQKRHIGPECHSFCPLPFTPRVTPIPAKVLCQGSCPRQVKFL